MVVDSRGDLYVVDGSEHVVDVFGPGASKPSFKLAEAGDRKPTSVLLSGSVDPEGLSLSACEFEYVPQRQFEETKFASVTAAEKASCSPEAAKVPVDSDYHAVQAEVTGLAQGGTYYYRLSGSTAGSTGGFSESVSLAFTTPAPPRVVSASAANISDTSVELRARIDPLGAATSYHFEYSSNGVSWVSTPEVGVGQGAPTGSVVASVVRQVAPLLPGTTYAFRVVAQNAYGSAPGGPGAEGSFTTLPLVGEGLPDGRAYEMLTPPDKGGAEDMFVPSEASAPGEYRNDDVGYPSGSGEEFLLEAGFAAFGTEEHPFAASGDNMYVFRRTGDGWQTVPLASPSLGVQSLSHPVFDPEAFSRVAFLDDSGSGGSAGGEYDLDVLGPAGGPYAEVHSEIPPIGTGGHPVKESEIVGASRDLGSVILETPDHAILPEDAKQDVGSQALYEYSGGTFALVSVNPAGSLSSVVLCWDRARLMVLAITRSPLMAQRCSSPRPIPTPKAPVAVVGGEYPVHRSIRQSYMCTRRVGLSSCQSRKRVFRIRRALCLKKRVIPRCMSVRPKTARRCSSSAKAS